MNKIKNFLNQIIFSIYPNKCVCCGEIIEEKISICNSCNFLIERINLDDFCFECGFEKADCKCKFSIFRFNAIISVFKNIGLARKAYYSYKFLKKQHFYSFFSEELYRAVKKHFVDISFDCVCSVPSYKNNTYDHSGYIASGLAQKLNLPFLCDAIKCVKKTKKQHKSTIEERIKNVNNKYVTSMDLHGQNVLLVDDIKTTGATLDECTKSLLYAGAESVYCITVLASGEKIN